MGKTAQRRTRQLVLALSLSRVRQWAEGKSARYFGKGEVDLFKGVNLDRTEPFPYTTSLRITHHFVDDYNHQYQRKIDSHLLTFPFRLDQIIINGRRFFEMAEHYEKQVATIINDASTMQEQSTTLLGALLTPTACKVLTTLNSRP